MNPAPPSAPRRLPGQQTVFRWSLGVTSIALWLGPHSLIESQVHIYRESYRHFDYGSIQALLLQKTRRGAVFASTMLIISAVTGALACALRQQDPSLLQWSPLALIALIFLALATSSLLRGPTCRVEIQTALGRRALPTLERLRPALLAIRQITENVDRVQGTLAPEAAAERLNEVHHFTL